MQLLLLSTLVISCTFFRHVQGSGNTWEDYLRQYFPEDLASYSHSSSSTTTESSSLSSSNSTVVYSSPSSSTTTESSSLSSSNSTVAYSSSSSLESSQSSFTASTTLFNVSKLLSDAGAISNYQKFNTLLEQFQAIDKHEEKLVFLSAVLVCEEPLEVKIRVFHAVFDQSTHIHDIDLLMIHDTRLHQLFGFYLCNSLNDDDLNHKHVISFLSICDSVCSDIITVEGYSLIPSLLNFFFYSFKLLPQDTRFRVLKTFLYQIDLKFSSLKKLEMMTHGNNIFKYFMSRPEITSALIGELLSKEILTYKNQVRRTILSLVSRQDLEEAVTRTADEQRKAIYTKMIALAASIPEDFDTTVQKYFLPASRAFYFEEKRAMIMSFLYDIGKGFPKELVGIVVEYTGTYEYGEPFYYEHDIEIILDENDKEKLFLDDEE